jgi:uncharacterized protein YjbI with pentapeptide repeats
MLLHNKLTSLGAHERKLTAAELQAVLLLHDRFVQSQTGGARACLKFVDLSHADLQGRRLAGADFTGAKLVRADLTGANLRSACLFGADMQKACLSRADLTRADLRGATLRGANIQRALLAEADLRDGSLVRSKNGELIPLTVAGGMPNCHRQK